MVIKIVALLIFSMPGQTYGSCVVAVMMTMKMIAIIFLCLILSKGNRDQDLDDADAAAL